MKVGETVCVLKQFKKTKSAKRIQKEAIETICRTLDTNEILHNDGNCRNVMVDNGKIYLIDYGFAKKIDSKILSKTNEPNIKFTLAMMKRSFRQNGIKAWL